MEFYKLQFKIVMSLDGKKLGTIVRIDESDSIDVEDETDYYAIIRLHSLFYRGNLYPLPLLEVTEYKIMGNEVRLNMSKKQFMLMVKQYLTVRKQKIKAAKMASVDRNDKAMAVNYRTKF